MREGPTSRMTPTRARLCATAESPAVAGADHAPAPAVFVHAFFRAGGTYLWSKFRACRDAMAFYEPFNESLGTDTRSQLLAMTPCSWESKHPALDAPYMTEYAPLMTVRGLPLFRKEFATATFFLEPGSDLPAAQCRYLAALTAQARRSGKRPVLGFSRSLGRVAALRRAFAAAHIVLMRSPAHQWMSCFAQCLDHGNDYFLVMHLMVAGQNRHHPLVREMAERCGIQYIECRSFEEEIAAYRKVAARLELDAAYRVFLAVYVAAYLEALPESDLVVDMDLLSHAGYRRSIERRIEALTRIPLDLSDAMMPSYPLREIGVDFARCHAEMLDDLARHCAAPPAARAAPEGADWPRFVVRAKIEEATRGYLEELRIDGRQKEAAGRQGGADAASESSEAMLLAARLNQTASRLKATETRLDAVMQSTSWKATAPLREIVDLLRDATRRGPFMTPKGAGPRPVGR